MSDALIFQFIAAWMKDEGWKVPAEATTPQELLDDLVRQADDRGHSSGAISG